MRENAMRKLNYSVLNGGLCVRAQVSDRAHFHREFQLKLMGE